ncbi:hypothetical protein LV78_005305 [Actinosynnema pretiosum]|nr:hypothetical protein [Actinosynnema pretiosum]
MLYQAPGSEYPRGHHLEEVVRGTLRSGRQVVLEQVRIAHGFPNTTELLARYALVGHEVPQDLLFDVIEFQVGGLTELSGVLPLDEISIPMPPLDSGQTFSARWSPATTQCWQRGDDELMLRFIPTTDYHNHHALTLTASPVVRVRGAARSVEQWLEQYVVPLAELTTLATGQPQQVAWLLVGTTGEGTSASEASSLQALSTQVFCREIQLQQGYTSADPDPDKRISDTATSLIPLGPGGADLGTVLDGWKTLTSTHIHLGDYLKLRRTHPDIDHRGRLMHVLPALEAFHDDRHGKPKAGKDEKRRTEVLTRVWDLLGQLGERASFPQEDMDFLEGRLAPTDGDTLARRYKRLAEANVDPELSTVLARKATPLPKELILQGEAVHDSAWGGRWAPCATGSPTANSRSPHLCRSPPWC